MLRDLAEQLARNRRILRRLPNGVEIYVTPDSQLKYLKGKFDTDLIDLSNKFVTKNSVVWDIGANCGVFAFSASNVAKKVVAFEADPYLVFLMQESVSINRQPVTIVPCAIFSGTGLASFSIARRGRASNFLTQAGGNSQTGGERGRILCPTHSLDDLLSWLDPPTLIKIDVEGAEVEVLRGGAALFSQHRPVIYFEATDSTIDLCTEILNGLKYKIEKSIDMNWLATPL